MAEDIQQLKNQVWYAKQKVQVEEKIRDDWATSLEKAKGMLTDAPSAEFEETVAMLEEGLAEANASLAPLVDHLATLQAQLPQAAEPVVPKFDPEKHPLLKKTLEKTEVVQPVVLGTGDMCEAYWREDRQWFKAKILSILGSASAPKYQVRYIDYGNTATLDRDALRPLQTAQSKRKREEPTPAAAAPTAPVTSTPHVISGPASINPQAQVAKQDVAPEDPTQKKRKVPNKKALEKTVNNWKNWNSKGVGKKLAQKDSMFRSGTTVDSRVGFTGSGAGMTQTNKRIRPDNKALAEADEDEDGTAAKSHRPAATNYPVVPRPRRTERF